MGVVSHTQNLHAHKEKERKQQLKEIEDDRIGEK